MASAKWHTNSFSFLPTGLTDGRNGYTIVPQECPYYDLSSNPIYTNNGVRITYFPAVHDRDGAIILRAVTICAFCSRLGRCRSRPVTSLPGGRSAPAP